MTDTVRRHANGSIDLDFYRMGATALRRQAMRDGAMLRRAFAGALVTMSVLGVAIGFATLPRQSAPTVAAPPRSIRSAEEAAMDRLIALLGGLAVDAALIGTFLATTVPAIWP